jgi:hypothetical protein
LHIYKVTKNKPEQLNTPELPDGYDYLVDWFRQLWTENGISWSEMAAWCKMRKVELSQYEIDLLLVIEQEKIKIINKREY